MNGEDPLLVDTGRGFSVYYRGRHLYNRISPLESAERRAEAVSVPPETIVFLPSPLLMYGAEILTEKLPEKSIVVAYEHDENLSKHLYPLIKDKTAQDSRLKYVTGGGEAVLDAVFKAGVHNFRRVMTVSLNAGYSLYRKEYNGIQKLLEEYVKEFWQNRLTTIHMAPLWIKNIFTNTAYLDRRSGDTSWSFPSAGDKPVVVTGAGESLEHSIGDIISSRDSIVILAVDTSLPILFRHNIQPDFIVAVDSQIYNLYDFFDFRDSKIPVFFDLTCYPGIARNFKGMLYPFLSNFSKNALISRLTDSFPDLEILPPLGSVGITAVHIALEITDGAVIHTGLDFSYSIGKSHARCSPFMLSSLMKTDRIASLENPDLFFSKPYYRTEDKNGEECITNQILFSYAKVMERNFGKTERLFDAGKTGLHTAGTRISGIEEYRNFQVNSISYSRHKAPPATSRPEVSITEFLSGEIRRMDDMYRVIYSLISGESEEREYVLKLLEEMDYVHIHFPDYHSDRKDDPNYLKRVLASVMFYRTIVSRQLKSGKKTEA